LSLIKQRLLFDIIQEKVHLGQKNSRGWYDCCCPVCGDRKQRFGFFHDGVFTSGYCYNCGAKFKYEEGSGKLSRNARQILEAFGIHSSDLAGIRSPIFNLAKIEDATIELENLKKIKLHTPEIALPDR